MVGRDQRELKNRLKIILLHLLKWQAQPARRGAGWRKSLRTQRNILGIYSRQSPSLRPTGAGADVGGLSGRGEGRG